MPAHSEQFHIRRVFEEITPLLNEHHAKAGFFYYDRSLRKYAVQAGPRTKNRLEFLLENDAELKKAKYHWPFPIIITDNERRKAGSIGSFDNKFRFQILI